MHIIFRSHCGTFMINLSHSFISIIDWESQKLRQFGSHQLTQLVSKVGSWLPSILWYNSHLSRQQNRWSLRCSWNITCRRCSNYIFIPDLTPGSNGIGTGNGETRRETFRFGGLVRLTLEVWWYAKKFRMSSIWQHNDIALWRLNDVVLCVDWSRTVSRVKVGFYLPIFFKQKQAK